MKEKTMKIASNFSKAIIQPVMFMAVSGLVISIAAIMNMDFMPGVLRTVGDFFFNILTSGIIGSLSIIFCIGIATATAKKKTDAAIISVTVFMTFLFANNAWLNLTNRLAEAGEQGLYGTGQNMVLGVQVNDMGVFLGIMLGCLVGFIVNKLGEVKFHKYLAIYEGTKFAFLVAIFSTILLAVLTTYVWPFINSIITMLANGMATSGPLGFFAFGFFQKMLLPVGMHHLLWMPMFYTPLGGAADIAGQTVSGAYNIWLASLGNIGSLSTLNPAIGFLVNIEPLILPLSISLAFIKTAKPENKTRVKAILIPIVILAILAGVTEPLDFLYLFTAPVLFVVTAVIFGLGYCISSILGVRVMVGSLGETIPSLFVPSNLGHQYFLIPIMLSLGIITYFVFKTLILKFNLPTLGREEMAFEEETAEVVNVDFKNNNGVSEFEPQIQNIVLGLGGADNIENIINCYTRLRVDVKDEEKVDIPYLKTKVQSSGIVDKGKHVQIIIGVGVEREREKVEAYIASQKGQ